MEKLKVAIIDDEKNGIEMLVYLLKKYCPQVVVVCTYENPIQAVAELPAQEVDLVFLDIDMPGLNGFQFLEKMLPLQFEVIFTTAYNEYALKAFKANATDYLLKPIDGTELLQAVNKAQQKLQSNSDGLQVKNLIAMMHAANNINIIGVSTDEGLLFIQIDEIVYLKAEGNYTELYLTSNKKIFSTKSLGNYEEQLNAKGFFRPHNSYIVNLKYIVKFVKDDGGYVVMQDGTSITVSRRRKDDFLKLMK